MSVPPVLGRAAAEHDVLVIVGFAEASAAPEVVWSLSEAGFRVVAFSRAGRRSALRCSRWVECRDVVPPERDVAGTLTDIQGLMRGYGLESSGPCVVLPLDDTAVWICSQLDLVPGWRLAGPVGATAELALDKVRQLQLAREVGFNVLPTTVVADVNDVLGIPEEALPVMLRPARCIAVRDGLVQSQKKWICANRDELCVMAEQWNGRVPLLQQPFVNGVGEGVFGLSAPDRVRAWSGHRRLRMMDPHGSGASACVSRDVPDQVSEVVERFVRRGEWRGMFMVEMLRDEAGELWFVEFNGRPWGSLALARRQGLEYPAWQVHLTLDESSSAGTAAHAKPGVVCRHIGRELMHVLFVLRGPKSNALEGWPSLWRTLREVAHLRSTDALYNWRREDPKVFFADCYYTARNQLLKEKSRPR